MAQVFSDANFQEILNTHAVVVADFWAEWCGPCRMVGPSIEALAEEYQNQAAIGKVNIEENVELTDRYEIQNIPTVLFFKNGQLVDKQVGAGPKSLFENKLKALL